MTKQRLLHPPAAQAQKPRLLLRLRRPEDPDGRPFKLLTVVGERTRECLTIVVQKRITSHEALMMPADLSLEDDIPEHIRSDNGPGFAATTSLALGCMTSGAT